MQPHLVAKNFLRKNLLGLGKFGYIWEKFGQNLDKTEAKFGQKWLDLGKFYLIWANFIWFGQILLDLGKFYLIWAKSAMKLVQSFYKITT